VFLDRLMKEKLIADSNWYAFHVLGMTRNWARWRDRISWVLPFHWNQNFHIYVEVNCGSK